MSDISFVCKVTSVHPANDAYGNEFVCVEFAIEAPRPPSVVQMPQNMPQEMSFVVPIISQIPKMLTPAKIYSNRLILFLAPQEWDRMKRKYQYGDEAEIRVSADGSITAQIVQT